jgi:AraC-like DNA-binding protein
MMSSLPVTAASVTERLRDLVASHAPVDGTHPTPLEGVQLFRVSAPVARVPAVYDPSACVVVGGSKRAFHDAKTHTYCPGHYLCTTVPTPVEAEVPDASPEEPLLGVLVDLNTRAMTEFMIRHHTTGPTSPEVVDANVSLAVAPWDERFTDALVRLLELLDDPAELQLLAGGRLREVFYALVEGAAGANIRATLGAPTGHLAPVLAHMRNNLHQPLAVEDLAARAGMSRAAFDRHFKATTRMSPLRYLKALRLNDAAMLISNGATITEASMRVGYSSPSQFSREFKRQFGATPRAWAKSLSGVDAHALEAL